jgi:hypothetical protein
MVVCFHAQSTLGLIVSAKKTADLIGRAIEKIKFGAAL